MEFSQQQQAAIQSRGENVLLSASAGSGKTSVLVERLCSLVLEDQVSVANLLAMTFTEDAAREMKVRLKSRLAQAEPSGWIQDQLALLENASISTIDSFCYGLVQAYYYRIPISWTMASTVENGPVNQMAFETALQQAMDQMDPGRMGRLRVYLEGKTPPEETLTEALKKFLSAASAKTDPEGWMENCRRPSENTGRWFQAWFTSRIQAMLEICQYLHDQAEAMEFSKASQQKTLLTDLQAKLDWLQQCLRAWDGGYETFRAAFQAGLESTIRMPASFNKHSFKKEQERYKKMETDIAARLYPVSFHEENERRQQDLLDTFIDLALDVRRRYAREKEKAQIIDFQDMEHFALQLLEDPLIRQELQDRYAHILVDEFQDTNDLQEAIIEKVSRGNNVFRVGDVKQSIYGFRQARPEIMLAHRKTDKTLFLQENYRSTETIIQFANAFFERIMDSFLPEDRARSGTEGQKTGVQKPVRFLFTEYGPDKEKYGSLPQARSRHMENRYDLIAQDILEQAGRGLEYRSICILTRSHTPQQALKETLEAWGIPVIAEVDHGFYTNQAIQVILSVLTCLADERDDISAVAMLCSPLGGVSHNVLAKALARRPADVPVLRHLKDSPLLASWNRIKAWRKLPVPQLLVQLYGWKDFYASSTTAQDKTNLDLLLEMAAARPDLPLQEFIQSANAESRLDKTAEAASHGKEENVVKIKTMHHAKGLQYPLVYVLSRTHLKDLEASKPIRTHPDLGVAMRMQSPDGRLWWPSRSSLALAEHVRQDDLAEEQRLLYVACTRAEKELVIVDTVESLEAFEAPLSQSHRLANAGYTPWLLHTWINDVQSPLCLDRKELLERPKKKRPYRPGTGAGEYRGPVTAISSQTASAAKKDLHWRKVDLRPNQGKDRGTLFHEMAARLPYPYQKEDILAYVKDRVTDWRPRDTEQILALNDNPSYRKWMQEDHVFEESYNTLVDGKLTHGFMDLVVYEPDRTVILDFKSDYVEDIRELETRYRPQLETYKRAMEKIRPGVPVVTAVYSFHFGQLWDIV